LARFYLTTAIDYANGDPHMGHAYEKIGADAIARYRRLRGDDVWFVIGMDEHGQKVQQEAESQGRDPQDWVDDVAVKFRRVWERLEISHDDFIRTTEPRHEQAVAALIDKIDRNGDIYTARYEGYYCSGCEAFRKESELVDGRCPLHPTREILSMEEENYFFRLSDYRDRLLAHIEAHPQFIQPVSRRNEILGLLRGDWMTFQPPGRASPGEFPFRATPNTRCTSGSTRCRITFLPWAIPTQTSSGAGLPLSMS
jgi:methionyl-tRNA synthetase